MGPYFVVVPAPICSTSTSVLRTVSLHWRDVPDGAWRWPIFSPVEIACHGTGKLLVNEPALDKLQVLRDRIGKLFIVRSAYRSPELNRAVGGAQRSKHLLGEAFDIAISNHEPVAFEAPRARSASSVSRSITRALPAKALIRATGALGWSGLRQRTMPMARSDP